MKNRELVYLILMTTFAVLFLISFAGYRDLKEREERLESEIKAYELLMGGNIEAFMKLVEEKDLDFSKELKFYLEKFAQLELFRGETEMEMGNYGEALEHFSRVLSMNNIPKSIEYRARIFKGRALYELKRYEQAYRELVVFLNDAEDFRGRGEGLVELAKVCIKLGRYEDLGKIKKELRSDERNLKRLMDLESEM